MTHGWYLLAAWGSVVVIGGIYIASVLVRGRRLAERVPEDRRRWISSEHDAPIGEN